MNAFRISIFLENFFEHKRKLKSKGVGENGVLVFINQTKKFIRKFRRDR